MKIFPLLDLSALIEQLKADGSIIVQCHGCFDLFHVGHLYHLEAASKLGDILIVTITADEFVNKGDGRPVFAEDERAMMLEALECVDYVAINNAKDAGEAILLLKPDIYVKGIDYIGMAPDIEQLAVQKLGGKTLFTTTEKHSSTDLIERYLK